MRITVKNTGKRARIRAGHTFKPGETIDVEVSPVAARAVKATRDLQVVAKDVPATPGTGQQDAGQDDGTGQDEGTEPAVDVTELTVAQALQAVEDGRITSATAREQEEAGDARVSLLDQLDD